MWCELVREAGVLWHCHTLRSSMNQVAAEAADANRKPAPMMRAFLSEAMVWL